MPKGIITFLQCLPKLISIIDRLGRLMQDHEIGEWMCSLEASIDDLEKAKGSDEKGKAVLGLLSSIRSLK